MTTCSAYGCTNKPSRKSRGITFHRFPKDNDRRTQWIKAVQRKNWTPSRFSKLCSRHFPEEMIDRTSVSCVRLRENAVPTIFEGIPSDLMQKRIKVEKPCEESTSNRVSSSITENIFLNQVKIKVEEPWEEGPDNYVIGNVTENSQVTIQDVRSLVNTENTQCSSSWKGKNTGEQSISKNVYAAGFQNPFKIDKREEIFGRFVACELSALHENSELYLRTKQSILNVLMEVHFKQMRSSTITS